MRTSTRPWTATSAAAPPTCASGGPSRTRPPRWADGDGTGMPRTGVCAAGWVLLLAALLGGCGEGEVVQPRPSELAADTVTVSEEAAARLRRGHYADVHDLAQALSLPTAFARSEALHALVSRC